MPFSPMNTAKLLDRYHQLLRARQIEAQSVPQTKAQHKRYMEAHRRALAVERQIIRITDVLTGFAA